MSELEHIDPVSIHSLLTTEALSGAGRSSLSREGEARIEAADVIFAHDTDTGRERLVHGRRVLGRRILGRRVLEEMTRSCETRQCAVPYLTQLDQPAERLFRVDPCLPLPAMFARVPDKVHATISQSQQCHRQRRSVRGIGSPGGQVASRRGSPYDSGVRTRADTGTRP